MSLFDVIKYPISEPPTLEELNALPNEIFNQWISLSHWRSPGKWKDADGISHYYKNFYGSDHDAYPDQEQSRDVKLLRKLIEEYNELI